MYDFGGHARYVPDIVFTASSEEKGLRADGCGDFGCAAGGGGGCGVGLCEESEGELEADGGVDAAGTGE